MKLLLAGIIVIISFNKSLSQGKAKQRADSLEQLMESQDNPYKNTLSWDFSNILHSVNLNVYTGSPYYNYPSGYAIPSGFPASVYFRHRIIGKKLVRRDRFKYIRSNISFNYISYPSPDSSITHINTQNGTLIISSPGLANEYFASSISLGLEWAYHKGRFQIYYALDLIGNYTSSDSYTNYVYNNPTSTAYQYYTESSSPSIGLSPCAGINYYFNQRLIIGIETAFIEKYVQTNGTLKEVNLNTSEEKNYQLPTYYSTQGNFIPLRAIKLGINF